MIKNNKKYFCPCCGYKTLDEKPPGTYNICEICFWEDDNFNFENPNYQGGANSESLYKARMNFSDFGASKKRILKYVRKPTAKDERIREWKSLGYPTLNNQEEILPIIFYGNAKALDEKINKDNINDLDSCKINYLQHAIAYKQNHIAKNLIAREIDLNNKDNKGYTPLAYAVEYKNFEIAELILENGGDVDLVDNWGNTPLWYAAFNSKDKNYDLVELLINAGADPNHFNKAGTKPTNIAEEFKEERLLNLLSQKIGTKVALKK